MSSTIAGGDTGSEAAGRSPVSRRGSRALIVFYASTAIGGVLPSLAVTIAVYAVVDRYRT